MERSPWIAERTIYAVAGDGRSLEIQLGIGTPYEVTEEEWACPVRVDGLHDKLSEMHGVDSWQALQLSCQLAARLLEGFVQDGGRLFWEKDGEQVQVADLFAKVSAF